MRERLPRWLGGKSIWQQRQDLAAPARYYGDGGTIHDTGTIDVQTHDGQVLAVWFRCQMLAFRQSEIDFRDPEQGSLLTGVEVRDR